MNKKTGVFAFGVFSYLFGFSAILGWIGCMLGIIPFQYGLVDYTTDSVAASLVIAVALVGAFALQHTIMANDKFKEYISTKIPAATERSLFVLMSGAIMHAALLLWPKNSTVVWSIDSSAISAIVFGVGVLGWAYLFAASFAINHFELFGLEQTYSYYRGVEAKSVPFTEDWMYSFDRHPIMTGALIGMWFTPEMTVGHLMFSAIFSLYIVAGVSVEEKRLVRHWGKAYMDYKSRVKTIVPTFDLITAEDIALGSKTQLRDVSEDKKAA